MLKAFADSASASATRGTTICLSDDRNVRAGRDRYHKPVDCLHVLYVMAGSDSSQLIHWFEEHRNEQQLATSTNCLIKLFYRSYSALGSKTF